MGLHNLFFIMTPSTCIFIHREQVFFFFFRFPLVEMHHVPHFDQSVTETKNFRVDSNIQKIPDFSTLNISNFQLTQAKCHLPYLSQTLWTYHWLFELPDLSNQCLIPLDIRKISILLQEKKNLIKYKLTYLFTFIRQFFLEPVILLNTVITVAKI